MSRCSTFDPIYAPESFFLAYIAIMKIQYIANIGSTPCTLWCSDLSSHTHIAWAVNGLSLSVSWAQIGLSKNNCFVESGLRCLLALFFLNPTGCGKMRSIIGGSYQTMCRRLSDARLSDCVLRQQHGLTGKLRRLEGWFYQLVDCLANPFCAILAESGSTKCMAKLR